MLRAVAVALRMHLPKKTKKAIPVHLELRDFEILCLFLRWKLAMDIPVC